MSFTFQVDGTMSEAEISHSGTEDDHPAALENVIYQVKGEVLNSGQQLKLTARYHELTASDSIRCRVWVDGVVVTIQEAAGPTGNVTCLHQLPDPD